MPLNTWLGFCTLFELVAGTPECHCKTAPVGVFDDVIEVKSAVVVGQLFVNTSWLNLGAIGPDLQGFGQLVMVTINGVPFWPPLL